MQRNLLWTLPVLLLQVQFAFASQDAFLGSFVAPKANSTQYQVSEASKGNMTNSTEFQINLYKVNMTSSQESQVNLHKGNMTSSQDSRYTTIATTTSKPLFPANPLVGSVDSDDTALTMKVIHEGLESALEKFKKANARLAKMTCAELDEERQNLEAAYEDLRDKAIQMTYESSRANALKSLDLKTEKEKHLTRKHMMKKSDLAKNTRSDNVDALKAVKAYDQATILHMNALEQYALKCGVKDKWCEIGDTDNNNKFATIKELTGQVDAKFTEAGWLRNEAVGKFATTQTKDAAEYRWGEAMRHVGAVWSNTKSLTTGLEVVTAACGLRPPPGDWAKPRQKCNLKPQDPLMQALLRDDPQEFVRRWKEIIGKKAGITPDKVVVNVADCF